MGKQTFSDDDRATIKSLRDSGLSWAETSTKASKKLGRKVSAESCRFQYRKAGKASVSPSARATQPRRRASKPRGRSLDSFRDKFDVTKMIQDKVDEVLTDDEDHWFTDDEFRQLCGVSVQNWRRHAELDEFKSFQFRKPGLHAWGPPHVIQTMREITGVQG